MGSFIEMLGTLFDPRFILVSVLIPLFGMAVILPFARLQEKRHQESIENGQKSSWHQLTGGNRSKTFFDIDGLVTNPDEVGFVADWYVRQIKRLQQFQRIDRIAFIENDRGPIGALALTGLITQRTGIPAIIIRLRKHLAWAAVKNPPNMLPKHGDTVVFISDVATTGRSISKAIRYLLERQRGVKVPYAVVFVDRQKGASKNLYDEFSTELIYYEVIGDKEEIGNREEKAA